MRIEERVFNFQELAKRTLKFRQTIYSRSEGDKTAAQLDQVHLTLSKSANVDNGRKFPAGFSSPRHLGGQVT